MKFTLMVRFNSPGKKHFVRKPAAYGRSGRVKPGWADYKDLRDQRAGPVSSVGVCTYDIRVEDKGTTYIPAGKNGTEAEAKRLRMVAKATGRESAERAGLTVTDPEAEATKRIDLREQFDEYIEDAQKRDALEAMGKAVLVANEFLAAVKVKFLDEVARNTILEFDGSLRTAGPQQAHNCKQTPEASIDASLGRHRSDNLPSKAKIRQEAPDHL